MNPVIKNILKQFVKFSPIPLTKGEYIDRTTAKLIKRELNANANCVDVGAHKGEILDIMLEAAPNGQHFAFEPLPYLYEALTKKYAQTSVELFPCALSAEDGASTFQFVTSNPAYSGILRREYDRPHEDIEEINVQLKRLDDCIPEDIKIHFIKIDVEGAELLSLKGASRILSKDKPLLIFEHGKKGSNSYGYDAGDVYDYLTSYGYAIYTLKAFKHKQAALSRDKILNHFNLGDEFYFVAK